MSAKNRDEHNRWRNKTVAFRVSPEEDKQIEAFVQLSGLTKQDYITRRLLNRDVIVQGNPRVYKALRNQLTDVLDELKRISRCGMGPCQGRTCRDIVLRELAEATGIPVAEQKMTTFRPPAKSVKLGLLLGEDADEYDPGYCNYRRRYFRLFNRLQSGKKKGR